MIDPDGLNRHIVATLTRLRISKGLTQRQAAKLLGIKRTAYTNLETHRARVPLHVIYRAAQIYDLKVADILPRMAAINPGQDLADDLLLKARLSTVITEDHLLDKVVDVLKDQR